MFVRMAAMVSVLLGACVCPAQETELRKWTDSKGKFTVQARVLRVKKNTVLLRRVDGVEINVLIELLSDADREFLKSKDDAPAKPSTVDIVPAQNPADQMVFTTFRHLDRMYSLPGLAFASHGGKTFVMSLGATDRIAPTDEKLALSWNIHRQRADCVGQPIAQWKQFRKWIVCGPADKLPAPLPPKTPTTLREGLPVTVWGYSIESYGNAGVFARARADAKVCEVVRVESGNLERICLEGADLHKIQVGIVAAADGTPVAFYLPGIGVPGRRVEKNQMDFWPLELLRSFGDVRLESVEVAPVAGDLKSIEYEFIVRLSDPFETAGNPRLMVKPATGKPVRSFPRPGQQVEPPKPLEDATEIKLVKQPPSKIAQKQNPYPPTLKSAVTWIGKLSLPNPGNIQSHQFDTQLVYDSASNNPPVLLTRAVYTPQNLARAGITPPPIPGLDGRPLDMPPEIRHKDGGFVVTSSRTKADDEPLELDSPPRPNTTNTSLTKSVESSLQGEVVTVDFKPEIRRTREPAAAAMSFDGKFLYVMGDDKRLHKIDLKSMTDVANVDLDETIDHLAATRSGLIAISRKTAQVLFIDASLKVKTCFILEAPQFSVGSPTSDVGFVLSEMGADGPRGWALYMFDCVKGRMLHVIKSAYGSRNSYKPLILGQKQVLAVNNKFVDMQISRDGKRLILIGRHAEFFRIEGQDLIFESVSPRGRATQLWLTMSDDGKQICVGDGFQIGRERGWMVYSLTNFHSPKAFIPQKWTFGTRAFLVSPNDRIVIVQPSGQIEAISLENARLANLEGVMSNIKRVIPSPDGKQFYVFSDNGIAACRLKFLGE